MTEEDIKEKIGELENNELYKNSSSPFKQYQYLQFLEEELPLNGEQVKKIKINKKEIPVIFRFDENGLIHSDIFPAIEYLGHWEYWQHGLIKKIVDKTSGTVEWWNEGFPVNYEKLFNT